ncbi:MAG: YdcF family protein [Pseudomonadota bacterium]|jgi:hypothetical protein
MDPSIAGRAILKALVLPPLGPLLLVMVGLWVRRARRAWSYGLIAFGILSLLALSLPIVADGLAARVAQGPSVIGDGPAPQAIVVLSGGVRLNADVPSGASLGGVTLVRLATAAALARRTGLPLLLSGGRVESGPAEATVMAGELKSAFGLTARFIEDRSRNTHENAVESARLLQAAGLTSVWLVTSAVHMPRAAAEFRATGLRIWPASAPGPRGAPAGLMAWLPHPWALQESYSALYEWVGRVTVHDL